ncbi:pentalenene synthase [Rhodopirellula bahusiensis]|uniref:Pentalenene synthase n=1 Tax=Rhodopirellula bahusiensis TaxID=2014065 RepID=A0A2G1WAM7_9BACT|nr:pentalenene synthase [Rhodopirellula bahusiensis]
MDVDPTRPERQILHLCETDGTPIRPLVTDEELRDRFDHQGTPEISADGKHIAFDAVTYDSTRTSQQSRIVIVDFDGDDAINVIDGELPSFSPDGKRLVFSRQRRYTNTDGAEGTSVWMMDIDGGNKKMVAHRGAWGGRWSPDGKSIVFYGGEKSTGVPVAKNCLRLFDIESETTTNVFSPDESPFGELSFQFEWAKDDSRRVVFGGPLKDTAELATGVIQVDQGISSLTVRTGDTMGASLIHGSSYDWKPDGNSFLMSGTIGDRILPISVSIDLLESLQTFDGIPDDVSASDPIHTPDGKHLIVSFRTQKQSASDSSQLR